MFGLATDELQHRAGGLDFLPLYPRRSRDFREVFLLHRRSFVFTFFSNLLGHLDLASQLPRLRQLAIFLNDLGLALDLPLPPFTERGSSLERFLQRTSPYRLHLDSAFRVPLLDLRFAVIGFLCCRVILDNRLALRRPVGDGVVGEVVDLVSGHCLKVAEVIPRLLLAGTGGGTDGDGRLATLLLGCFQFSYLLIFLRGSEVFADFLGLRRVDFCNGFTGDV